MKFVKHFKSSFFTALLECGPGKRVDDGVDTGCLVVSICNPSCCTAFTFFYCFLYCLQSVGPRQWPSTPGLGGQRLYMLLLLFSCFRFLGFF